MTGVGAIEIPGGRPLRQAELSCFFCELNNTIQLAQTARTHCIAYMCSQAIFLQCCKCNILDWD